MQSQSQKKRNYLGFLQKKATVREFVILLTLGLIAYAVLHILIPPRPKLSLKADEARVSVLEEIDTIQKELDQLDQKLGSTETPAASPAPTGTPAASPTPTGTPAASPAPTGTPAASPAPTPPNLLPEPEVKEWQQNLQQNSRIFLQERLNKKEEIETILKTLSQDFKELNEALAKQPPDIGDSKKILSNLEKDLTKLKGYLQERTLFWTGDAQWIEVVFWSLFGTLIFLIQQTSQYYLREDEDDTHNEEQSTDTLLTRRKPQYYSFILQSPFITLVILWILSLAEFNIAGVSLAFASIQPEVLVSLAFILGLYNQVATTQLSMIVGSIFKDAWQKTLRRIEINPSSEKVEYGQSKQFNVIPDVKVRWSIWSKPALGAIDAATGMYIAAPEGYFYAPDGQLTQLETKDKVTFGNNYQQVIIRATREDEESISALGLIILTPIGNGGDGGDTPGTPQAEPTPPPSDESGNR